MVLKEWGICPNGGYMGDIATSGKILGLIDYSTSYPTSKHFYNPVTGISEQQVVHEIHHQYKITYLDDDESSKQQWSIFSLMTSYNIDNIIDKNIYHEVKYIGSVCDLTTGPYCIFVARRYTEMAEPKPSDTRLSFIDE